MTDLPLDIARCQGQTDVVMGQPTLSAPCTDCRRRTSSREGNVSFIAPPTWAAWGWFSLGCPQRIAPVDVELEGVE